MTRLTTRKRRPLRQHPIPSPGVDPAPAGQVEVQDRKVEQSASACPHWRQPRSVEALTGMTLVLLGYTLVRFGRRKTT